MSTNGSPRLRWVSLLGLFMMLVSATPMGVAAQVGLTPVGDVAQGAGMGIELLLVDCPPGAPDDPSDLIPGCTDGRAGLNINVSSVDPALGIDQDKVSVKPSDPGPGIINTGEVPLGQYLVRIDLSTNDNRFFFECRLRGTETAVPTSPSPDGAANAFIVSNDANADVVCQAWITPAGANPTMEITYRECAREDFPSDGRTFEDLQANCTNVSTNPPTFNVRHLSEPGEPVTQHQQNANGIVDLTLSPGNFDLFTNLEMDDWGEYLFCEYEGQPRYQKDFDPQRGIVTFNSLLPGEEFTCHWFGVSAAGEASAGADQQQNEPANESEVIDPQGESTQNLQGDDQQLMETQQELADPQFTITYRDCDQNDFADSGRSFEQLSENCTNIPNPGPTFTILDSSGEATHTLNETGVLSFQHSTEDFSIYTNLPLNEWGEYLFCEYEGVSLYQKNFDGGGINGFSELEQGQVFECYWFSVQVVDDDAVDPPAEDDRSIRVNMRACDVGYEGASPETLAQMQADCTEPVANTLFTLADGVNEPLTQRTNDDGEVAFTDLADGSWSLWSEIPLEFANELYFCSGGDDDLRFFGITERGVAEFNSYTGQTIFCEVYVVPENLRGDVTGASVEVHLALCPANYEGSSWYNDCHDNGLDGYDFTLTGPDVELTDSTVVERTPGPGIVRFTELAAGDYELMGGPPQHDGSVFLYCSDPSTNTQVETTFEGGKGYFALTENQSVVCDWYFVPVSQAPETPTPEPTLVEIFTTMFVCPPDVNVAGASFSQLDSACADRLNDVPMTLQSPGGVPITANTGVSGEGAVRFYDLLGGDYVLTPKLPTEYVSAAVYCDLDGGSVYQKALANGATTFVNVEGELISCSWFVTAKPQPAPGPTGSITIREMLCEGDRSSITDWERECQPGASGVSFTITSSGGDVTQTLTPNAEGVAVFSNLPNEYYDVKQSEGAWCRAMAERVDSQSRVIVSGGGNTDVFLYQCNQQIGLPDTGTGPIASDSSIPMTDAIMLGAGALPLFAAAAWQIRRWQMADNTTVPEPVQIHEPFTRTRDGYRFR